MSDENPLTIPHDTSSSDDEAASDHDPILSDSKQDLFKRTYRSRLNLNGTAPKYLAAVLNHLTEDILSDLHKQVQDRSVANPSEDWYISDKDSDTSDTTSIKTPRRRKRLEAPQHWMLSKMRGIYVDQCLHKMTINKDKKLFALLYASDKIELYRNKPHPSQKCHRYKNSKVINFYRKTLIFQTTVQKLLCWESKQKT